jgi:hypothetical protein
MTVIAGTGVGSPVKLKAPETLLLNGRPVPLPDGPFAASAPDPTEMLPNAPPAPPNPPAKLGTPVMFPGRRLEMPPRPVMYKLVGTGTPLTEAADPLLGPLLPSEPAADTFAPGNGMINEKPLVVSTKMPMFAIAGETRSSSMQSSRLGRNAKRVFILDDPERTQSKDLTVLSMQVD